MRILFAQIREFGLVSHPRCLGWSLGLALSLGGWQVQGAPSRVGHGIAQACQGLGRAVGSCLTALESHLRPTADPHLWQAWVDAHQPTPSVLLQIPPGHHRQAPPLEAWRVVAINESFQDTFGFESTELTTWGGLLEQDEGTVTTARISKRVFVKHQTGETLPRTVVFQTPSHHHPVQGFVLVRFFEPSFTEFIAPQVTHEGRQRQVLMKALLNKHRQFLELESDPLLLALEAQMELALRDIEVASRSYALASSKTTQFDIERFLYIHILPHRWIYDDDDEEVLKIDIHTPSARSYILETNELAIEIILRNVTHNALKAMAHTKHPDLQITFEHIHTDDSPAGIGRFRLSIQDSGPGIKARLRSKIFQRGYTTSGTGQGLATSKAFLSYLRIPGAPRPTLTCEAPPFGTKGALFVLEFSAPFRRLELSELQERKHRAFAPFSPSSSVASSASFAASSSAASSIPSSTSPSPILRHQRLTPSPSLGDSPLESRSRSLSSPPRSPKPLTAPRAERVLVVDDEPTTLKLLVYQLKQLGFSDILTAHHSADALDQIHHSYASAGSKPIYGIFTDQHMPQGDGLTLARQIRAHSHAPIRAIPVYLLTGGYPESGLTEMSSLFTAVYTKPITLEQLKIVLNTPKTPDTPLSRSVRSASVSFE